MWLFSNELYYLNNKYSRIYKWYYMYICIYFARSFSFLALFLHVISNWYFAREW